MKAIVGIAGLLVGSALIVGPAYPHGGGHGRPTPRYKGPSDTGRTPRPGGPSTPGAPSRPSGPGTPSTPGAPVTPGGGPITGGRAPGPGGPVTRGGGVQMVFERMETSKELLKMRWQFPKSLEIKRDDGPTIAVPRMYALSREEALARLTEKDKRPLLIYRDCSCWKGYYHAELYRKLEEEKTRLYARWFQCIKLQENVIKPNHTFHKLFDDKSPPHLVLCSADGSNRVALAGNESLGDLWKGMSYVLRREYRQPPEPAIKELLRLMSKYDYLDTMKLQLREQMEGAVESSGEGTSKLARLKKRLAKIEREHAEYKQREKKVLDLGLLRDSAKKG